MEFFCFSLADFNLFQMCARCLTQVIPFLDSDALDTLIDQSIGKTEHCQDYLSFLKEFCVILVGF